MHRLWWILCTSVLVALSAACGVENPLNADLLPCTRSYEIVLTDGTRLTQWTDDNGRKACSSLRPNGPLNSH